MKLLQRFVLLATVTLSFGLGSFDGPEATASTWKQNLGPLRGLEGNGKRIELHPFAPNNFNSSKGFRLFQGGTLRFDQAVATHLREQLVDPLIEIRARDTSSSMALHSGSQSQDFRFFVGGVPLCDYAVRAHSTPRGSSMILGNIPDVTASAPIPGSDWPDLDASYRLALRTLLNDEDIAASQGGRSGAQLQDASRCLRVESGVLAPVWRMHIALGGLPHEAVGDTARTYNFSQSFFDVAAVKGEAKIFEFNVNDTELKTFDLPGLIGDSTLTSDKLTTFLANGGDRAEAANHKFEFDADADEFPEVSAYTHAQIHLSFFEGLGFKYYGPGPLEIRVHDKPHGETNNALFVPASSTTPKPTILLGDGDGKYLQNLATDSDVVAHELGHFIIYQYLTTTSGESLVLHEGLADFFAFARTGNACLGESICPEGEDSVCWIETQHSCLRTGETDLKYGSVMWEDMKNPRTGAMGHLHGQAISGVLWDLRAGNAIPAANVTKLTFQAISYLGGASGFRDFLLSLFLADKALFESAYFDAIRAAIIARGFEEFITDITTPDEAIPLPTGKNPTDLQKPTEDTPSKKSKSSSDSNPFKCGVVAGTTSGSIPSVLGLLLMLAVLAMPLTQRVRHLVPVRMRPRPTAKARRK